MSVKLGKLARYFCKPEIAELFGVSKKYDKVLYSALSLLSGSSVKLFDIFDDEALKDVEKKSVSFSSGFDDNANDFQSYLGDALSF